MGQGAKDEEQFVGDGLCLVHRNWDGKWLLWFRTRTITVFATAWEPSRGRAVNGAFCLSILVWRVSPQDTGPLRGQLGNQGRQRCSGIPDKVR